MCSLRLCFLPELGAWDSEDDREGHLGLGLEGRSWNLNGEPGQRDGHSKAGRWEGAVLGCTLPSGADSEQSRDCPRQEHPRGAPQPQSHTWDWQETAKGWAAGLGEWM